MYLNQFSVRVIGGKEVSGGYVELDHGKPYRLCIRNDRTQRADAHAEIDGKHVGTWRLEPHQSITLERPAHDRGKFTFYQVGTKEARQAGLAEGDPSLGLVRVTFTPEISVRPLTTYWPPQPAPQWQWMPWDYKHTHVGDVVPTSNTANDFRSLSGTNSVTHSYHSAGGTGLEGHSGQEFGSADYINHDYTQQTVIHLRLVAGHAEQGPRPLTAYSTPIPPAVR